MSETTPFSAEPVDTGARLGWISAICNALASRDADFFPRIAKGSAVVSMSTEDVLREMNAESACWENLADGKTLDAALEMAKYSLAEVKAQTEYQDQKATRILTITTFLGALSGALFTRLDSDYPLAEMIHQKYTLSSIFVSLDYIAFALFLILSVSGALVTFHAIRTRFKYPPTQRDAGQENDPKSLLFFDPMIRSRPRSWVGAWVSSGAAGIAGGRPAIRSDLQQRYLQHVVKETYLIAAKTADKIRYLEPAQSLLASSLKFLLIWIVLLGLTNAFVPVATMTAKPAAVAIYPAPLPSTTVEILMKNGAPSPVTKPAAGTARER